MELSGNTVLVTGGASGIGFALAERFVKAGSTVIICGRRVEQLEQAKRLHPGFQIKPCDIAIEEQRIELVDWATKNFPSVNFVINNAGIQRRVNLLADEPWSEAGQEIAINLAAPIHLSRLFIPHLMKQKNACIANVTSGLSFVPLANVPIYCATKAALHSYTLSLRHQLRGVPITVVEIIPPAVNTDLGGPGLHTFGVSLDAFADAVFSRWGSGETEIAYGTAEKSSRASREELDQIFRGMNQT